MNEQPKNINPYSLEDIERYLQGKLSPAEMHELEKAAVQDPFLADAIEGYQATDLTVVKQDIADIHDRLSSGPAKVFPAVTKKNNWWRVAAAILLLAGTGILGLKLFNGKNNTQELAQIEKVVPLQKDSSHAIAAISSKKEAVVPIQKNEPVTTSSQPIPSLKKRAATDNPALPDIKGLPPVAALSAKPYRNNEALMAKDTALFDKIVTRNRDILAASSVVGISPGLQAQANSVYGTGRYLNKSTEPLPTLKTESANTIVRGANITAGYLKPTEQDITAIGGLQSLTIAGNIIGSKRSGISTEIPVLTDQKIMHVTLPDIATTSSAGSAKFEVGKLKKDPDSMLAEIVVTNYSYDKSPKKELSRSGSAAQANNAKREILPDVRESSVAVYPTGGWYNFTKYLTGKIAVETNIKRESMGHGTVEIKMNISKSGKVSKVSILNSFNTQLNTILIKAIRNGPRWSSTDYLEKKDFIFKVEL